MRLRHLIAEAKTMTDSTSWSAADLPPRHAPVFARTIPMRAGWRWRSARAEGGGLNYTLLAQCNARRGDWKALLMVEVAGGHSVVARLEDHASHPGLHVHAHCDRGGIEVGAVGLDELTRTPNARKRHRRVQAWTEGTFWEAAKRAFRVAELRGSLL